MEQLSGLDTAFVHQDTHRTPMHICAALIYDAGEDDELAISLGRLRELASERLAEHPLFRRKLKQVPMGMDAPYWVDVDYQDWDWHIREDSLPGPGDWESFESLLGQIHGARMDLSKPLWEMHLIHNLYAFDGLPLNCQALVLKVHHSAIDGISLAALIAALHAIPTFDEEQSKQKSQAPSQWELWARANFNTFNRQLKLAETIGNLVPGYLRARETRQQFRDLPPIKRGGCHFNARVQAGRNIGCMLLPKDEVMEIRRSIRRVTVNDIAMACVAGALREYLDYHDKLPARSLSAGIPINLRDDTDDKTGGNKIATMVVGLATHVEDPVERLRMIHRYAVAGKKQINALGSGTVMDISDSLTPGVLAEGIRTMAWASQVAEVPVPFHTMISNVPGLPIRIELDGAELVVPIGLGPVRDNMGLFHIVSSSEKIISLAFSACRKLMPDPDFYRECLEDAFDDLYEAALSEENF